MNFIIYSFLALIIFSFVCAVLTDLISFFKYLKNKFFITSSKQINKVENNNIHTIKNAVSLQYYSKNYSIIDNEILKDYFKDCYPYIVVSLDSIPKSRITPTGHILLSKEHLDKIILFQKDSYTYLKTSH